MKRSLFILTFLTLNFIAYSQGLSNDTVHWVEYRKLAWDDFKGESIDVPGLTGQTLIVVLANYHKMNIFFPTKTSVITVFDRKNSWINKMNMTDQALKYYQVMFDLYEAYARKLRKEFKNTKFGFNPNKVFQEKYNLNLTALSDRNKQYMKETKMGTNLDSIEKWDKMIQKELWDLEEFK